MLVISVMAVSIVGYVLVVEVSEYYSILYYVVIIYAVCMSTTVYILFALEIYVNF